VGGIHGAEGDGRQAVEGGAVAIGRHRGAGFKASGGAPGASRALQARRAA
jgi:hypothetical protein